MEAQENRLQELQAQEELQMWKEMYMRLLRGVEKSISVLIQSEQDCEELYISANHTYQEYRQITEDAAMLKRRLCNIYGETQQLCRGHIIPPSPDDN